MWSSAASRVRCASSHGRFSVHDLLRPYVLVFVFSSMIEDRRPSDVLTCCGSETGQTILAIGRFQELMAYIALKIEDKFDTRENALFDVNNVAGAVERAADSPRSHEQSRFHSYFSTFYA